MVARGREGVRTLIVTRLDLGPGVWFASPACCSGVLGVAGSVLSFIVAESVVKLKSSALGGR